MKNNQKKYNGENKKMNLSQLRKALWNNVIQSNNFGKSMNLSYAGDDIDRATIKTISSCLPGTTTQEIIKLAFISIATQELGKRETILEFPCHDFMKRIDSLNAQQESDTSVELPRWVLMAVVDVVHNGYQTNIECIEDVINTVLVVFKQQLSYLWNPYNTTIKDMVN
jgi:hypothetical protein